MLWPQCLLCLAGFVIPAVKPDAIFFGGIGGMVCALAILVWWLFFSRAPWSERVLALALMILALFATSLVVHVSIRTGCEG